MIEYYDKLKVEFGTKIRFHPAEGKPFVAEAVQDAENKCDNCALFKEGIDCLNLQCADRLIFRKVEEDEAKEEEVG